MNARQLPGIFFGVLRLKPWIWPDYIQDSTGRGKSDPSHLPSILAPARDALRNSLVPQLAAQCAQALMRAAPLQVPKALVQRNVGAQLGEPLVEFEVILAVSQAGGE